MIEFRKVTVEFPLADGGRLIALHDIDLQIAEGEFVAVMGRNGSGKSTLARLCNGLVLPTGGSVHVDDYEISPQYPEAIPEVRRQVGMVFQNPENQLVATTVEREIAFGLENLGVEYEEMHRRVEAILHQFDLESYRRRSPHQLSGGEKQRLALAAVTVMEPRYLLLDEPTSLLDFQHQRRLLQHIVDLHRAEGKNPRTVVLITQFAEEALFASRLLILDHGRIALDGPPERIFLQEKELTRLGILPPIEFPAFLRLREKFSLQSVQELLLRPIL